MNNAGLTKDNLLFHRDMVPEFAAFVPRRDCLSMALVGRSFAPAWLQQVWGATDVDVEMLLPNVLPSVVSGFQTIVLSIRSLSLEPCIRLHVQADAQGSYLDQRRLQVVVYALQTTIPFAASMQLRTLKVTAFKADLILSLKPLLCLPSLHNIALRFEDGHAKHWMRKAERDDAYHAAIWLFRGNRIQAENIWVHLPNAPEGPRVANPPIPDDEMDADDDSLFNDVPDLVTPFFDDLLKVLPNVRELALRNIVIDGAAGASSLSAFEYFACPPPHVFSSLTKVNLTLDSASLLQFADMDLDRLIQLGVQWRFTRVRGCLERPTCVESDVLLKSIGRATGLRVLEINEFEEALLPTYPRPECWVTVRFWVVPLRKLHLRAFSLTADARVTMECLQEIASVWGDLVTLNLWTRRFLRPHSTDHLSVSVPAEDVFALLPCWPALRHLALDMTFDWLGVEQGGLIRARELRTLYIPWMPLPSVWGPTEALLRRECPNLRWPFYVANAVILCPSWMQRERLRPRLVTVARQGGEFLYEDVPDEPRDEY